MKVSIFLLEVKRSGDDSTEEADSSLHFSHANKGVKNLEVTRNLKEEE